MDDIISYERSYATALSNSSLLPLLLVSLMSQKSAPNVKKTFQPEYDYIVVGAGSAGSVVASRLAEIPCVNVLLLEAGTSAPLLTDVPSLRPSFAKSDVTWQYITSPQKYAEGRRIRFYNGRGLGGSSMLNYLQLIRGNRKDYDNWANSGADGWSYSDVLPYFKKLEKSFVPTDNPEYHGYCGPLPSERVPYKSVFTEAVFEAAKSVGYPKTDPNGPDQNGISDIHSNLRDGQAVSTAKAYLVPNENRPNLHIVDNAYVTKVVIKKRRARGVEVFHGGKWKTVRARREVILSAGALRSPQLLMLSGIGPKKHLQDMGIRIVADLPVGNNLQDHPRVPLNYQFGISVSESSSNPKNIWEFIRTRRGALTTTGYTNLAFLNNREFSSTSLPDNELYIANMPIPVNDAYIRGYDSYQEYLNIFKGIQMVSCQSSLLRPRSRGTVRLNTTNPFDAPIPNPNYLQHPQDLTDIVGGLKHCNKIFQTPTMKKLGSKPLDPPYPGCEEYFDDEDKYFRCLARYTVFYGVHYSCSVPMGRPTGPNSVLDPELRVIGIRGLRVVDASVMPFVPSGNTNVPTIMIAEKASDLIKQTITCNVRGVFGNT